MSQKFDSDPLSLHVFSIPSVLTRFGGRRRSRDRNFHHNLRGANKRATTVGDMIMVMGVSDSLDRGNRGRFRPDARRKKVRSSRFRRIDLEGLESRTLLATIPAAAATALPANLSSLM